MLTELFQDPACTRTLLFLVFYVREDFASRFLSGTDFFDFLQRGLDRYISTMASRYLVLHAFEISA
jgi:hypothetical protein